MASPSPTRTLNESNGILPEVIAIVKPHCRWLARINGGAFRLRGRGGSARMMKTYRLYRPEIEGEDVTARLPDLIGVLHDGRPLAIEVKVPGGKVSDGQAQFLEITRQAGGVAGICYDKDDASWLMDSCLEGDEFSLTSKSATL